MATAAVPGAAAPPANDVEESDGLVTVDLISAYHKQFLAHCLYHNKNLKSISGHGKWDDTFQEVGPQ
jgi:hypothetical protein